MKDPARISSLMAELTEAWQAQPDLDFPQLWALVQGRGIGWGSSDDEVRDALRFLKRTYPGRVSTATTRLIVIECESPDVVVSLDGTERRVTVRRPQTELKPTSWVYREIKRAEVGYPLILVDEEGLDHRLGVVKTLRVSKRPRLNHLSGRARADMGDDIVGVVLDNGFALVGHAIDFYEVERREVHHHCYAFNRLVNLQVGSPFEFTTDSQRTNVSLGKVIKVFVVDSGDQ